MLTIYSGDAKKNELNINTVLSIIFKIDINGISMRYTFPIKWFCEQFNQTIAVETFCTYVDNTAAKIVCAVSNSSPIIIDSSK